MEWLQKISKGLMDSEEEKINSKLKSRSGLLPSVRMFAAQVSTR
jgi:hypothetical protein